MPGWHKATEKVQQQGKLQLIGIILEQQPERARLFMQWKQMSWPLMADPLNVLGVDITPITVAIDECGIVREVQPTLDKAPEFLDRFLNQNHGACAASPAKSQAPDLKKLKDGTARGRAEDWREYGDALILWGDPGELGEAINAYDKSLRLRNDGSTQFRIGVAYRKRYDSSFSQPTDFQRAEDHWQQALDINPNQILWRRRSQQYGPYQANLHYDWIPTARKEITARGNTPVSLRVEPSGVELETPLKGSVSTKGPAKEPDPRGRINRDRGQFIRAEITAVPRLVEPGTAARFHIVLRPNLENKAYWNNEAEDLVLWVNSPPGWAMDHRYLTLPRPPQPETQETRKLELEVRSPQNAKPGTVNLSAYALYYVCEDVNGVCMYRRQDLTLKVDVR